jgi:hypothetical protein
MKDDAYYKLLEEVKSRIFSNAESIWDLPTFNQLEPEMNRAKEILISSGHDLKDVREFASEVQAYLNDSYPR